MDEWRTGSRRIPASIDEALPHRREAFYRLYSADDADVRAMWKYADKAVAHEWRNAFVHTLVIGSDAVTPDERLPCYGGAPTPGPRLRTREQRHARKLAGLLQLLRVVTPPRCRAHESRVIDAGADVEYLIIYFGIGQVPRDYDQRWRLTELGIEYTTDSKRGWVQHRRASDRVRTRAVAAARALATLPGATKHHAWLTRLATDLEALPMFMDEHQDDIELWSQKSSYADWLRYSYRETLEYSATPGESPLRIVDWATLTRVITGIANPTPDAISHAIADIRP